MRLLGLDISSTNIGWCLLLDGVAAAHGTLKMTDKTIGQRCWLAGMKVQQLFSQQMPDALAIEGPAHHARPLALVQQSRVTGVVLGLAAALGLPPTIEVPPTVAKKRLTGKGNAKKEEMIEAARQHLAGDFDEHAADALGVALAALDPVQPKRKPKKAA